MIVAGFITQREDRERIVAKLILANSVARSLDFYL